MTELREELTRVLRTVDAGDAPVEETMRYGRAIRTRRRAAIATGALAVIAAVAGYSTLAHQLAVPAPAPAQHHDPVVTDAPPARGSTVGAVAEGKIGSKRWQVILKADSTPGTVCLTATIDAPGTPVDTYAYPLACGIPAGMSSQNPADFSGSGDNGSGTAIELGNVAPNVVYLVLNFADGQQLKLIPVTVSGHRYVAFAAPLDMPVASVTAHLGSPHFDNGKSQTAIPFDLPGEAPVFSAWLRQDEPVPPRLSESLGSGTVDGTSWRASAYQGPWGTCVAYTGGSYCTQVAFTGTGLIGWGASPMVVVGRAAANVAYLEVTMSDGTVLPRVTPVRVGEQRLFAFAVPQHSKQPGHWTAYSAAGTRLSSGTFGGT